MHREARKMLGENVTILKLLTVSHGVSQGQKGTRYNYSSEIKACELIFRRRGGSLITWDGETFLEQDASIRFLPNTGKWTDYRVETTEPGEWFLFSFLAEGTPDRLIHAPLERMETVEKLFSALWRTWSMRQDGYYHRCMGLCYEILSELDRPRYLTRDHAELLQPAILEIEKNLFGTVDCTKLHTLCGVSYTHFKNLFIRKYGMPPKKYMTRLKMQIACEQLERRQMSIGQIADLLGYSGADYFSRLFHQEMGCTAEEYRRRMARKGS